MFFCYRQIVITIINNINEHIKQKQFAPVYLLYGEEAYLKRLYRNRLRDAVLGDGDPMNSSYFQGKQIEERDVLEIADTLPFFAERRVVVIEESGWFKRQSEVADYIPQIPSSTVLALQGSQQAWYGQRDENPFRKGAEAMDCFRAEAFGEEADRTDDRISARTGRHRYGAAWTGDRKARMLCI